MKTISAALMNAIKSGTIATCVRLESQLDGEVVGFTNHDRQLIVDGVVYKPTPGLQRIVTALRNNAEVSNQEFAAAWVMDLPQQELQDGKWDNALISVYKVNWDNVNDGSIEIFRGNLGLIQWNEDGFRADVQSLMKDLQKPIGIQTTPKCRHQLFSVQEPGKIGWCGVDRAAHTVNTTIVNVITNKIKFKIPATGRANDWATNGIVKFTSGSNNNLQYEIKSFTNDGTNDVIELFLPTHYTFNSGDNVTVYAGCDKTWDTCRNRFNNGARYGGFPHIRNEVNFK